VRDPRPMASSPSDDYADIRAISRLSFEERPNLLFIILRVLRRQGAAKTSDARWQAAKLR